VQNEQTNPVFAWHAHPAKERRNGAIAAIAIILGIAAAAWLSFGIAWGIAAAIILVLALNRFFFPSRFEIDEDGITARYPLRKQRFRWTELRRFVHDEHGGYLSRRAQRSGLDAYSGMHVLFGQQRQGVIERIRQHVHPAGDGGRSCPS
jgi:hypothetical protein